MAIGINLLALVFRYTIIHMYILVKGFIILERLHLWFALKPWKFHVVNYMALVKIFKTHYCFYEWGFAQTLIQAPDLYGQDFRSGYSLSAEMLQFYRAPEIRSSSPLVLYITYFHNIPCNRQLRGIQAYLEKRERRIRW